MTEKITIELWCDEDGREALVREAYRTSVSGGIEALCSAIVNGLAAKLASADQSRRRDGFEVIRLLLGVASPRPYFAEPTNFTEAG
jgi:hypothetical protein